MVFVSIRSMETLNLVKLACFKSNPLGDPSVAVSIRLSLNFVVVSPARSPMSDIDFCHGVGVSLGSIELVSAVEPNFAEVQASHVETVVAGFRCLEPTIGVRGSSRHVVVVVFKGCHQPGVHHGVNTIGSHAPVGILFGVSRVDDVLAQTR